MLTRRKNAHGEVKEKQNAIIFCIHTYTDFTEYRFDVLEECGL